MPKTVKTLVEAHGPKDAFFWGAFNRVLWGRADRKQPCGVDGWYKLLIQCEHLFVF